MRKFYETYKDLSNLPTALAKLPWNFNNLLIDRIDDVNKRIWYAEKCIENSWSYVVLDNQIDIDLYDRQADKTKKLTNYSNHLPEIQGELAIDVIKDPYIFELAGITEKSKELDLCYMEKFYLLYKDKLQIFPQLVGQLFSVPYLMLRQ